MAIARGGPTRSRSESSSLGNLDLSVSALYGYNHNFFSDPTNVALSRSSVTGARGSGVVANTNAKGNRYFSDSRCSCPSIDGSDGGNFVVS